MPEASGRYRWYHKMMGLLFVVLCFELGVFLLVFPWMNQWEYNYFAWIDPRSAEGADWARRWRQLWLNPYFRGAVSGLGVLNLYVAAREILRLRRFSEDAEPVEETPVSLE